MEAGTRLLHPPPLPRQTRTHLKNSPPCSVAMLHDQSLRMVGTLPTASAVRHSAVPIVSKEQLDDYGTNSLNKEVKNTQATLDKHQANVGISMVEEYDFDQYQRKCDHRLLYHVDSWYRLPSLYSVEKPLVEMPIAQLANPGSSEDKTTHSANSPNSITAVDVLAHAAKAAVVSREAALLEENNNLLGGEFDECRIPRSTEGTIIRSKRLLERQSKTRKAPKNLKTFADKSIRSPSKISKKIDKSLDSNDPLRLFLWDPETKRFLTVRDEQELFLQIQDLRRLKEVQERLRVQFNREPTSIEWAQAAGMSCQGLRSCLLAGRHSREKIICSNFRLVVHLARQYEGRGIQLQDLLQEGSRGLIKSFEKFNPKVGCKFSTYAYWWIRQFIRKAIFRHSRLIRLPDNVFASLKEIKYARRLCIQEGHLPTNEEIAKMVGITAKKLDKLLLSSRDPVSIQQCACLDITFQEITADPSVENPDLIIAKQLMRTHLHHLLKNLEPKERHIIQYRFGVYDNRPRTLGEIGEMVGLSNERVRQLVSRGLDRLKECLPSEGLAAYRELLV